MCIQKCTVQREGHSLPRKGAVSPQGHLPFNLRRGDLGGGDSDTLPLGNRAWETVGWVGWVCLGGGGFGPHPNGRRLLLSQLPPCALQGLDGGGGVLRTTPSLQEKAWQTVGGWVRGVFPKPPIGPQLSAAAFQRRDLDPQLLAKASGPPKSPELRTGPPPPIPRPPMTPGLAAGGHRGTRQYHATHSTQYKTGRSCPKKSHFLTVLVFKISIFSTTLSDLKYKSTKFNPFFMRISALSPSHEFKPWIPLVHNLHLLTLCLLKCHCQRCCVHSMVITILQASHTSEKFTPYTSHAVHEFSYIYSDISDLLSEINSSRHLR